MYGRYSYYSRKNLEKDLNAALKNGGLVAEVMAKNGNYYKYFEKLSSARAAIRVAGPHINHPFIIAFVNKTLVPYYTVDKVASHHWWLKNNEMPKMFELLADLLTDNTKEYLVDFFVKNITNLYSYVKKTWIGLLLPWISKESDALEIIKKCHKSLLPTQMEILVNKLQDGEDNAEVKEIFEKSKVLKYSMVTKEQIDSNPELRKEFVRDVAKTITVAKKAKFDVELTIEDIKALAPMMRFDFLSKVLCNEIYFAGSKYYNNYSAADRLSRIDKRRKMLKLNKIKLPTISVEDMKELVFAATIKNHEQVSKFLTGYSAYLELLKNADNTKKSYSY